jgi:hypothetical protein
MRTCEWKGKAICVPGELVFSRDDHATGNPVYVGTGYVQGEPEVPHTWRLFWYGSGLTSRIEPAPDAQPFQGVEI